MRPDGGLQEGADGGKEKLKRTQTLSGLGDDYVKFIRFAEDVMIEQTTGEGSNWIHHQPRLSR